MGVIFLTHTTMKAMALVISLLVAGAMSKPTPLDQQIAELERDATQLMTKRSVGFEEEDTPVNPYLSSPGGGDGGSSGDPVEVTLTHYGFFVVRINVKRTSIIQRHSGYNSCTIRVEFQARGQDTSVINFDVHIPHGGGEVTLATGESLQSAIRRQPGAEEVTIQVIANSGKKAGKRLKLRFAHPKAGGSIKEGYFK